MSAEGNGKKTAGFTTDVILHGGDYNPDQWLERPDILEEDIRLLRASGCNEVTLGVFAWAALEPEEGRYEFGWMEQLIDRLHAAGIRVILSTPSGARPRWMAEKYPEILRMDASRRRMLFGERHNHCLTSQVYREKTAGIDRELSRRFGRHPGVVLWHISNEFSGECHCPLCQEAFRSWLKERYGTVEELNRRWYTAFWSRTYRSFDQVESPSPVGEPLLHGLNLDWRRFVTEQTASFAANEREALREFSDLPVTTNLMYHFSGVNYFRLAKEIDVVSWDTYPSWHRDPAEETALKNGLWHDVMRSLLRRPFLQMESCPSATNWHSVSKLKRPGVLTAQALQAVAHGGDGAMYFQIRQSRGGSEKFHGAVIDHYGKEDTRVFREVRETGAALAAVSEAAGSDVTSRAAILYDWENNWARNDAYGPRNEGLHDRELLLRFYRACKRVGVNVDFVDETGDLSSYDVLILPMAYQFRTGFADKLRDFVREGGQLAVTFLSGVADENDLCYLGGAPHGLLELLGIRSTEIDGLYDWEENHAVPADGDREGFFGSYTLKYLCDLPELRGAEPVLVYQDDFYRGLPVLTRHAFGKGTAWYLAAYGDDRLTEDLAARMIREAGIPPLTGSGGTLLPEGLMVNERSGEKGRWLFFQNFGAKPVPVPLPVWPWEAVLGDPGQPLPVWGTLVLREKS